MIKVTRYFTEQQMQDRDNKCLSCGNDLLENEHRMCLDCEEKAEKEIDFIEENYQANGIR